MNLRPREKAMLTGLSSLSDIELMALFVRTGTEMDVLGICTELFKKFTGFIGLKNTTMSELQKIKGIGKVKALEIKALFEFSKRLSLSSKDLEIINSPKQLVPKALLQIKNFKKESFILGLLNESFHLIYFRTIYEGTQDELLIDPKEIVTIALKNEANSLFCYHNHPSGSVKASDADIIMTKRIENYCTLLGVEFMGHYILNEEKDFSLVGD